MSTRVLVDTCVWTAVLRRSKQVQNEIISQKLVTLIEDHNVVMIGPIRQEILSGIKRSEQFNTLRKQLSAFPDEPLLQDDFETAAIFLTPVDLGEHKVQIPIF